MKNQGGGLQWHSSVIFIPIPQLVNHLCTFPLTFDSNPHSRVRIRTCNNKLSFCLGIVSCQIRGRGSRATGPLGRLRESPGPPHRCVGTNMAEPFNCYFIQHLPPRAQSSPPTPPPCWCPGKQNGPDSFVIRGSVQGELASDFQIHCPC